MITAIQYDIELQFGINGLNIRYVNQQVSQARFQCQNTAPLKKIYAEYKCRSMDTIN